MTSVLFQILIFALNFKRKIPILRSTNLPIYLMESRSLSIFILKSLYYSYYCVSRKSREINDKLEKCRKEFNELERKDAANNDQIKHVKGKIESSEKLLEEDDKKVIIYYTLLSYLKIISVM